MVVVVVVVVRERGSTAKKREEKSASSIFSRASFCLQSGQARAKMSHLSNSAHRDRRPLDLLGQREEEKGRNKG